MSWLIQTAVANAIAAAVLAVLALIVSRTARRPALTHALWVLVLIKLVTPPVLGIAVPVDLALSEESRNPAPAVVRSSAPSELRPNSDVASRDEGRPAEPSEPRRASNSSSKRTAIASRDVPRPSTTSAQGHARSSSYHDDKPARLVVSALLVLWGVGVLITAGVLLRRLLAFHRALRSAALAPASVQRRTSALGRSIGLRWSPPVWTVGWVCSPMLFGCGRATRLVFPKELWDRLDEDARDSLLLHELAHFRRGDQWVRMLELVVTVLFWWHPAVCVARRAIAVSEEECCDAWVADHFACTPRTYAEALLATLDFIADRRPALPPVTSGVRELPVLRQRLTQIMRRSVSRSLSKGSRGCLLMLAVSALPLYPAFGRFSSAANSVPRPVLQSLPPTLPDASVATVTPSTAPPVSTTAVVPPTEMGWWTATPPARWATATAPGSRYRLVAETERRVILEHLSDGTSFDLQNAQLTCAAFTADGDRFVAGSLDGSVRLWDAATGEAVSTLGWHEAAVSSVAVSPDGQRAVSGGQDGTVLVWDLASGSIVTTYTVRDPVASVRYAVDGLQVVVAAGRWQEPGAHAISLLDPSNGELLAKWSVPAVAVAELTPRGALLTVDWAGVVREMDRETGQFWFVDTISKSVVSSAAFSPDDAITRYLP